MWVTSWGVIVVTTVDMIRETILGVTLAYKHIKGKTLNVVFFSLFRIFDSGFICTGKRSQFLLNAFSCLCLVSFTSLLFILNWCLFYLAAQRGGETKGKS